MFDLYSLYTILFLIALCLYPAGPEKFVVVGCEMITDMGEETDDESQNAPARVSYIQQLSPDEEKIETYMGKLLFGCAYDYVIECVPVGHCFCKS